MPQPARRRVLLLKFCYGKRCLFTLFVCVIGLQMCLILLSLRKPTGSYELLKKKPTAYAVTVTREQFEATLLNKELSNTESPNTELPNTELSEEHCKPKNHRLFPFCEEKFQYVKFAYSESKCFKNVHGINGSHCSILQYLSEIEPYCQRIRPRNVEQTQNTESKQCEIRHDLDGVLSLLPLPEYRWLKQRLAALWPDWKDAADTFKSSRHFKKARKRKKILVYMGSMDFQRFILERAGNGGFVGELVQWTDLIASAYVLGHDVRVVLNGTELKRLLQPDELGCASKSIASNRTFDLIFTDINGFARIRSHGTSNFARLRCKLRILDSFGTEAEFNLKSYREPIPGGKSLWAGLDLVLQQFMTYFPHSPDNSFIGIAEGNGKVGRSHVKKNQAVIYAKNDYYLMFDEHIIPYLNVIKDFFEIHATMQVTKGKKFIPSYVVNHGVMRSGQFRKLLAQSKVFIGLGFPFEGPGGLEAIANGAVVLNPKYDPPKNKFNDNFFKSKPTLRKLTSQNPYLEDFVGEPYVSTIDIKDLGTLKKILKNIKERQVFPNYLPREFSNIGMLERVHAFIQYQQLINTGTRETLESTTLLDHIATTNKSNIVTSGDFCDSNFPRWPPLSSLEIVLAPKGVSCKQECRERGKICEPTYFSDVNSVNSFARVGLACSKVKNESKLYHPSYDPLTRICYMQDHYLYFSCVAEKSNFRRICPCRDFQKGQTALCNTCL
eukprot:gene19253-21181_t